jgi:cardiolipin synthase
MSWWSLVEDYFELMVSLTALLGPVLSGLTLVWILNTKKNPTSAVAWCLTVWLLPVMGPLLFLLFGYQHVNRPLSRKRKHMRRFQMKHPPAPPETAADDEEETSRRAIQRLAQRFGALPVTFGNHVTFYHEGVSAFDAKLEAIRQAEHHIHLEYFIFHPDGIGCTLLQLLAEKARQGVHVRLLYDAMGSRRLVRRVLQPQLDAGGKCSVFLPISLLRRRVQVNMRNHRKILVVDGRVAFTGGLNVGDEYLGKSPRFGFWRDSHLRVEGPAVASLQRVFAEDWDFAASEDLTDSEYFPKTRADGPHPVQVIDSGPDREEKGIREIYFAAILKAKRRLWIASPYFVPDAGLLDAICLAGYMGVDVRLLCQFRPDKWIPLLAAHYYWSDVLAAGVKVYQYTKGMMHSKVVLVDDDWASVGTANLDNRSMYLNFEVNCLIYSPEAVAELDAAFRRDLQTAIRLERKVYAERPFPGRILENACRLLSPVL